MSHVLSQALIDDFVEAERAPGRGCGGRGATGGTAQPDTCAGRSPRRPRRVACRRVRWGIGRDGNRSWKTWLAAFDATRPQFHRVLFVAHREEILLQTREVFRQIRPDAFVGLVMGEQHDADAEVVLTTAQSLVRRLDQFPADILDYVVVDEFHHPAAPTDRRVVESTPNWTTAIGPGASTRLGGRSGPAGQRTAARKHRLFEDFARVSETAESAPEAFDITETEPARQVIAAEQERLGTQAQERAGNRSARPA